MIGEESVSHQNLVRESAVCMWCAQWVYLDEKIEIVHKSDCAFPNGEKVQYTHGGNQYRATVTPPRTASQIEAASFPYVPFQKPLDL